MFFQVSVSSIFVFFSILYRQKLFIQVTEKLLQHCDSANHLTAFGYLLEGTPYQIFQIQFRQILKLLVLCLDSCDRTPVLLSVLDKLKVAIENADKNAEEYMEEILPRLLKLAEFKQSMVSLEIQWNSTNLNANKSTHYEIMR